MAITVVTPADWRMVPPSERGASSTATMPGMMLKTENPCLFLLEEPPNYYTSVHSHSEPEVIVILDGRMIFNGQWCERGTVVYVPADEDYWHATGDERCVVALMRPTARGKIRRAEEATAAQPQAAAS